MVAVNKNKKPKALEENKIGDRKKVGAKNKTKDFKVHNYGYYSAMGPSLTRENNKGIKMAIVAYETAPNNESAFQLCIGAYICSNDPIRDFIEEKFKGSRAIRAAKTLLEKEGKKNTIEGGFVDKLKKKISHSHSV